MADRTPATAAETRAERIRRIVDQAPPLDDARRRQIAALLRAPADTAASRPAAA